jgi:hypothetical protein
MTKFNITSNFPSFPGSGNHSPEKRVAPEVLSFAFYGRKPKIAGAVIKLRVVANSNPGIEAAPVQPAVQPQPDPTREYLAKEGLRQAAAGMLEEFQDEGLRNQDYIDFLTHQANNIAAGNDTGADTHEYELPT